MKKLYALFLSLVTSIGLIMADPQVVVLSDVANYIDFQALSVSDPQMTSHIVTSTTPYELANGTQLVGHLRFDGTEGDNWWVVRDNYNYDMPTPEWEGVDFLRGGTAFKATKGTSIKLGAIQINKGDKLIVYYQPNGDSERGVKVSVSGTDVATMTSSGVKINNVRPAYAGYTYLPEGNYASGEVIITIINNTCNIYGIGIEAGMGTSLSVISSNHTWGYTKGSTISDPNREYEISVYPYYGYHFTQWSDGNIDNPRTIVLTQDTTFTAEFAINTYSLSVYCDNISGTIDGESGTFIHLTEHTFTAMPNYGYHFVQWSDGATDNPRTIILTQETAITAEFAKNIYEVTKLCNSEQGSISGVTQAEYLDNVTLSATPKYGYHFTQWSDGNTDNPRTIVMTQDTTFTAEFAFDITDVCGDDNMLTWTFDSVSGTLAISGSGALNSNYTFGLQAPTQTARLIIEEGVTSVGDYAFKGMGSTITSVALPNSLTTIGDSAFAGFNNRKFNTLVLPNTIISIGAHAFDGASYLKTIHFGSVLEEIGDYAFNGCVRVQEMTCLAEITPNVGTDGIASINSLAKLYVPNDYLFGYQIDPNWSRFVLSPIGATETTVSDNDVTVSTDDNTATLTWPTSNTADSYTIEITKDGEVFCQLIFNANGQLTGIAFAPSRNGAQHAPAATMTANGMQFTVTGLNSATHYGFTLTAKSGNTVVASYSGDFETTGAPQTPTSIDEISSSSLQGGDRGRLILRNGQILIIRGDKTYTVTGQELR